MKNTFKIIGFLLLINGFFSCGTSEPDSGLHGEYEYIDESDGRLYEAQIKIVAEGPSSLAWIGPEVGMVPITEYSDFTFRISPFEIWGDVHIIKGELKGKELHVTREVFDLNDLNQDVPISTIHRIYIKK